MTSDKKNPAAANGGASDFSYSNANKTGALHQDIIHFWLYQCHASREAYDLLEKYQYRHDWIKFGDLGGIHARITGKYFEADRDGIFYVAQPVWYDTPSRCNEVEEPVLFDIIAWHPNNPRQWYFLRGESGLILGEKAMFEAGVFGEPLQLHSSPLAWIRSGCKGSVLLDHHGLNRLYGLRDIVCEDVAHGTRIEKGLRLYYKRQFPRLSIATFGV